MHVPLLPYGIRELRRGSGFDSRYPLPSCEVSNCSVKKTLSVYSLEAIEHPVTERIS